MMVRKTVEGTEPWVDGGGVRGGAKNWFGEIAIARAMVDGRPWLELHWVRDKGAEQGKRSIYRG
jgi:hypothetical protein